MKNVKDFYTLFDDDTTCFLLNYIRKNIYRKYPYKSLSKSSLLVNFKFEQEQCNIEYIQAGISKIKIPYKWDVNYKIYYNDKLIGRLEKLEIKYFNSKSSRGCLEIRNKQFKKFNKDFNFHECSYCKEEYLESKSTALYEKNLFCSDICESYWWYDY